MSNPQADPRQLMPIGAVAAHNIAAFLNLDQKHVGAIEQAIKDEINAMSSHFTLAIADVQTQYEAEVAKLKTDYTSELVRLTEKHSKEISELRAQFGV